MCNTLVWGLKSTGGEQGLVEMGKMWWKRSEWGHRAERWGPWGRKTNPDWGTKCVAAPGAWEAERSSGPRACVISRYPAVSGNGDLP